MASIITKGRIQVEAVFFEDSHSMVFLNIRSQSNNPSFPI